jgi:malate dehydrogenase (oxaloacetate-decarboxylating)
VGKKLPDIRVTLSGVGAAGTAVIKLLKEQGVGEIVACDRQGIVTRDRPGIDGPRRWVAEHTNASGMAGSLREALAGADVFIGVSAANLLSPEDISRMAEDPIVFALANPDPEVDPFEARKYAAVLATGRSDFPNQINNVLAFPGVFRGLLDAGAKHFTDEMELAAAQAIADAVGPEELNASYIVPSVFDPAVSPAVAAAIRRVAGG